MKRRFTVYTGGGMQTRSYLDDVRGYTEQAPRFISRWGRADSVYHWVGCIVRLKRSYWKDVSPAPFGIVIEVGRASWLVALWADSHDPREHLTGREVDCWHFQGLDSVKHDILARRVSDEQLLALVRQVDEASLIPTS